MNKKLFSAALFGALLLGTASTFVSCKDYDDDIAGLQTQINDVKATVAALEAKVNAGKFVTGINSTADGITISLSDGSSYSVTNGKNGAPGTDGTPGTVVTIDEEGFFVLDGKTMPWKAVTEDGTAQVKVPFVDEDGMWVFFDENGEEVVSPYKANGAAYAVEANGGYTLYVPDVDGTMQTVFLPGEGAAISELEILGYTKVTGITKVNGFVPAGSASILYKAYRPTKTSNWKGNKGDLTGNEILVAYNTQGLVARVAPANVDATNVEFTLVNTKGKVAPVIVSMYPFANNDVLTRAASANGMYSVELDEENVVLPSGSATTAADWARSQFEVNTASAGSTPIYSKALFALKSNAGLASKYDVAFEANTSTLSIKKFYIYTYNTKTEVTTATSESAAEEIALNKNYEVYTNCDEFLYDAYLEFNADQVNQWGIKYDKAAAPVNFTVSKLPDTQTPAPIKVILHYVTKQGGAESTRTFYVTPKTNLNSTVQLCDQINHLLVKTIPTESENSFIVPMTKMIEAMGSTAYTTWKNDADLTYNASVKNYTYSSLATDWSKSIRDDYTVTFLKADKSTATTVAAEAQYIKVLFKNNYAIDLTKNYDITITFKGDPNKYLNGKINAVSIPVKFSIPTIDEILVKEPGVFVNNGNVAHAYMSDISGFIAGTTPTYAASKYALASAFNKFKSHINTAGLTFTVELGNFTGTDNAVNPTGTINAQVNNKTNDPKVEIELVDKDKTYKKDMDVKFKSLKYLGLYDYDDYNFAIRIMSPLKEGKFVAKAGAIKIAATGETNVTKADVWAQTYNSEVKYDIFKVAKYYTTTAKYVSQWDRTDIANVEFTADNNVFGVVVANPTEVAFKDAAAGTINHESFITLNGKNLAAGQKDKLTIKLTDKWGYILEMPVEVETTVASGN